jgi:imidazolonepropionase-like amidohydrolase
LKTAYQAGVKIVFGTDLQASYDDLSRGLMALEYIDSFIEAGIPPAEILKILTVYAYELLGLTKQRGTIAVGMPAAL